MCIIVKSYTNPSQHFEIRQQAFQYLYQIKGFDEMALRNLVQACKHPVWQFSKFSRELLKELMSNKDYRIVLEGIVTDLPSEEKGTFSWRQLLSYLSKPLYN